MKLSKKVQYPEIIFCASIFVFLVLWMAVQPFNVSPDEGMRYKIVEYLVKHGTLPHGGDPEIRDALWGISYAFNPILSYMISAVFVKVVSIFTSSATTLLMAARMVNVLLGTGTAFIVRRIAMRLFKGRSQWLFSVLTMFLPGTLFVFSYVNNDGLALFSSALIILMWVRSIKDNWSLKTCIGLGIGISLCALSYYNAYGIALCSVLFFGITILLCGDKKGDFKFFFSRGAMIAGIVLVLAGWWFVRSYILYDGDILGMRTSSQFSQLYAQEMYKPSNRITMQKMGLSIANMFFLIPGEWEHNWLATVMVSFVGTFGYMNVFMPSVLSKLYIIFFGGGALGLVLQFRNNFSLGTDALYRVKKRIGVEVIKVRIIKQRSYWKKESVFRWCMAIAFLIPFVLLVYYAYYSEFQAQGRYLIPGVIPIMYFVTFGYGNLLERFAKSQKLQTVFYTATSILVVGASIYTYLVVFLPAY